MSREIYFISDAHLGSGGPGADDQVKLERLKDLFDHLPAKDARLCILGDLFDFWFEYRTVVQIEHLEIIGLLRFLRDRGMEIDLLVGNHDYWIGNFLQKRLGIGIHHGPVVIEQDGRRFYLAHGDGLGQGDLGYKILKLLIRNPLTVGLFGLLHPDLGVPLARWFSQFSRRHLTRGKYADPSPLVEVARKKFSEGFDFVVLGHTHRPHRHQEGSRVYLNLGDFMEHFTYGVYRDGQLTLENIKPES